MPDVKKTLPLFPGVEIEEDGALRWTTGKYVNWHGSESCVTLDACFTIEELEVIIAHLKAQCGTHA